MGAPITVLVGQIGWGLLSLSACGSHGIRGSYHPVPVGRELLSQYLWVRLDGGSYHSTSGSDWMGALITECLWVKLDQGLLSQYLWVRLDQGLLSQYMWVRLDQGPYH